MGLLSVGEFPAEVNIACVNPVPTGEAAVAENGVIGIIADIRQSVIKMLKILFFIINIPTFFSTY